MNDRKKSVKKIKSHFEQPDQRQIFSLKKSQSSKCWQKNTQIQPPQMQEQFQSREKSCAIQTQLQQSHISKQVLFQEATVNIQIQQAQQGQQVQFNSSKKAVAVKVKKKSQLKKSKLGTIANLISDRRRIQLKLAQFNKAFELATFKLKNVDVRIRKLKTRQSLLVKDINFLKSKSLCFK